LTWWVVDVVVANVAKVVRWPWVVAALVVPSLVRLWTVVALVPFVKSLVVWTLLETARNDDSTRKQINDSVKAYMLLTVVD
jgi:hypothetical protein